jgi:UDP-glucose 4-epimerase
MRLTVTGASGFIGRNVLLRAPRALEIWAVYHQATHFPAFVQSHGLSHVHPIQCDLTRSDDVRRLRAVMRRNADVALYLAANGDPTQSTKAPLLDLQSNTVALLNFLEHCPVPHLIYMSSGAVYDGLRGPVSPASPVNPMLPYAVSKLASERYIRFYAEKRGAPESYVIVRFFGAYGPYEAERKITTRWLVALAEGRREFTLRGDGQNLIDFMYVDDAVDGLLRLVDARGERLTLDFGSGAPMTLDDLVSAMACAIGVDVAIRHEGHTAEDIRFHSIDSTMRDRFGFVPVIPLGEGLRRLQMFREGKNDAAERVAKPA